MEKLKNASWVVLATAEALAIVFLVALLIQGKVGGIPAAEAGKLAVDFINKNFAGGAESAKLVKAESANGVYKLDINYNGQDYVSYVTRDGQIFFTEGISIKPVEAKEFPKTAKPELGAFVMSFCPYGNQAEDALFPVVDLLKDKAAIKLHYIFYSNYGDAAKSSDFCYDTERKYCSMHGIQELNQDVREMCVAKYQPDKFWAFVKEINAKTDSTNVDSKWEAIAKGLGIDAKKIKDCYKDEALDLMKAEAELTAKSYPVQDPSQNNGTAESTIQSSPTIVLNGMIYNGDRTAEDIKKAICSAFETKPAECDQTLSTATSTASGSCE